MVATVHVLHPQPCVIGGFFRVGHTGHRKLEALHASGKSRFNRFVFDAGHIGKQIELLKALKTNGCETILDPNFAEMATVGGFAGLAAAAFGAVAGIGHRVCQKESFQANQWKRPQSNGGGATPIRSYIPGLDRYLTEEHLNAVFAAKGGKARVGCTDTSCCPRREDQIEHSDAHMLTWRNRQLADLSRVPEQRRAEHLLLRHIDPAVRSARQITQLKIADDKVAKVIEGAKKRLIRVRDAPSDLQARDCTPTRSKPLTFRGGSSSINAVMGR